MYTVYGDIYSGNCYKVKLALAQLGLAHRWRHVDILRGETREDWFLALNPAGKIPLLALPDGSHLPESGAILWYLAEGTPLLPDSRALHARTLQWMFFEQYSHEPYVAVARFIVRYLGQAEAQRETLSEKHERGHRALAVMEQHLRSRPFLIGERYSIADIALYAYTHVAHEGGFDLTPYAALNAWLARVRAQPAHITMDEAAAAS